MKKILISLSLALALFFFAGDVFATPIEVTEKIPGANCVQTGGGDMQGGSGSTNGEMIIYTCDIERGFDAVLTMIGAIIKYFTYIALLASVLFIVINGILYSMAGVNDSLKTGAKDRIVKTLIGLVILLLSGVILTIVAPWVFK